MTFMAAQCGYGVDVVPAWTPFEPPATLIDQAGGGDGGGGGGGGGDVDGGAFSSGGELAISMVDLQRYLVDGGALPAPPPLTPTDEEVALEAARRAAAGVMSTALRAPVARVQSALRGQLDTLKAAMLTPMKRVQSSIRGAAGVPLGREALDPAWGEEVPVARAASAVGLYKLNSVNP
jgi:hypothetical protein